MKTILVVIAMVLTSSVAFSQVVDPLSEGNKHFEASNYQAAADVYRRIVRTNLDVPTKAKAWFNLGLTYQKLGEHDEAINAFKQIFSMNVNDREPGGNIMEPYRNYRSWAQWQIGQSLFAKGDYTGALEAYRTTRLKYPLQSWCNVERQLAEHRYALHEGLTYEHLGLYPEAADSYLRVYILRVAELYEAAGQIDDLKQILSKRDQEYYSSISELAREKFSDEELKKYRPSHKLHKILEIHELGKNRAWPTLIQLLLSWSLGGGDGREDVVVRILARHPEETVPLLKQEVAQPGAHPKLIYTALGLAGTPEAVATLKSIAEKQENSFLALSLVQALSLAGKPGEEALAELEKKAENELKKAIEHYKRGGLRQPNATIKFPALPAKLNLREETGQSKGWDDRRAPETVTLFSRTKHREPDGGYGKSAFSFRHGVRSDVGHEVTRNNYELLYGNLNLDGDSDWFSVTMVTDDRSRIKDLGALTWEEVVKLPLIPLSAGTSHQPIRFPRETETLEESSQGRVTRVAEGHVYLVRSKDRDSDFYTVFRVEKLLPSDQVTISWRNVPKSVLDPKIEH